MKKLQAPGAGRFSGPGVAVAGGAGRGRVEFFFGVEKKKKSHAAGTWQMATSAFSPDGQYYASVVDGQLKVWPRRTRRAWPGRRLPPPFPPWR